MWRARREQKWGQSLRKNMRMLHQPKIHLSPTASKTHSTKLAPHQSVLTGEWLKSTGVLRLKPRITTFQRSRGIKNHTRRRGWSSGWIPGYLSNRLVVTTANLGYLAKKKKLADGYVEKKYESTQPCLTNQKKLNPLVITKFPIFNCHLDT